MYTSPIHYLHPICLVIAILMFCSIPVDAAARGAHLPPKVRLILSRISSRMEKKDYSGAVKMLTALQAKGAPPETGSLSKSVYHHPALYFALGNCYLLQGLHQEAAAAYRRTLDGDPTHTYAWLNLAKAHYEMKQYPKAGDCFARGYESEKKRNPEYLYLSAASYLMGEDYQRSAAAFERLLHTHPQTFKLEWKEYYVHSLLAVNRFNEAIPLIREIVNVYDGEKRIQWQEMLLYQYMQHHKNKEALRYAEELTEYNPQNVKWWKATVHIQLEANRYEDALAALIIYGFLTPFTEEEQRLLADLFLQVGIPAKAAPIYAQYLQNTQDPKILYRLALAYYQAGRPDNSLKCIHHYKELDDTYNLFMLEGEICYRLQRYGAAHKNFRKAADCNDHQSGRAWLMAGYTAMQMDDFSAGREAFARAAEYEKEKKTATTALQQLEQVVTAHVERKAEKR